MSSYEIALQLVQGKSVDRKDIRDAKEVAEILRSFKNNANLVIRQLKEVK